jgi:hypothetical protein
VEGVVRTTIASAMATGKRAIKQAIIRRPARRLFEYMI